MFANLKLIIQIFPYIVEIVKAVESALPEGGVGREKLAFVRELLEFAIPDASANWDLIEKMISCVVALFNRTGVFKQEG